MKALFFDMDGTLLGSDKQIPESAVEALLAVRQRGVKVFLSTGRALRMEKMRGWTTGKYLFDGGVYCNGSCICLDGEARYIYIPPQAVRAVLEEAERFPEVHVSLNGDGAEHAFNFALPDGMMERWYMEPEDILPLETVIQRCTKMQVFYKELLNSTTKLPDELYPRLVECCGDQATIYLTDRGATIHVACRNGGKLTGVETVRKALGLATEEIAVFGDDLNDLEMIRAYPVSVAMGNAAEEVKAAAQYVTLANDEGGIAHALKNILHLI